jgi:hypothetical protein
MKLAADLSAGLGAKGFQRLTLVIYSSPQVDVDFV